MWGIGAGLVLLVVLVSKKVSVIIAAPICAVLVSILNGYSPLDVLSNEYVVGLSFFIQEFLFIFILGATLGQLISDSGAAQTIAHHVNKLMGPKRSTTAVILTGAILAYGGVPGFVIFFSTYQISLSIFDMAKVPRFLLPACLTAGIVNFAIPMPGSPQVHNIIPMELLGTSSVAGLLPGIIGATISLTTAILYMEIRTKKLVSRSQNNSIKVEVPENDKIVLKPSLFASVLPLIAVIIMLAVGQFPVVIALVTGVLLSLILFFRQLPSISLSLNKGVRDSLVPLLFVASVIGFGYTLRIYPEFRMLINNIIGLSWDPLIITSIINNLGACAMGSASGGILLTISLAGEELIKYANASDLHRILTMSSVVLDTVPYNTTYLAILAYTGLSLKNTYPDYFVVTVITPFLGLVTALAIMLL